MSDDSQRPIVVKKIKKGGHGHHGGAWKIAYADFVTAMMAFFLLMWLLGSTSKGDLNGISEVFKNPLKVSLSGGDGSGDSSSLIKGGGTDLTRSAGQVMHGEKQSKKLISLEAALAEKASLEKLRVRVSKAVEESPALKQFKNQILLDMTAEGLRIQIVDEKNRAMFNSGSAKMEPYAVDILRELGKILNEVPNRISLAGHTDSAQYASGDRGYSNWELSGDRANASRRELIEGGIEKKKVLRVVGLADAVPFDKDNMLNPVNRRISITVLNSETENNIVREAGRATAPAGSPSLDHLKPEDLKAAVEPAAVAAEPAASPAPSSAAKHE